MLLLCSTRTSAGTELLAAISDAAACWCAGRLGEVGWWNCLCSLLAALLQAPHPALAVLEGPQFRQLVLRPDGSTDLDAFAALWPHLRVMARCTPADKYTLVQVRHSVWKGGGAAATVWL